MQSTHRWAMAALSIDLLPKQWEVFRPTSGVDYDVALYQGGVGSGKTFLGTLIGLTTCYQNPGCTWLVGADSYARLSISTWETYRQVLSDARIDYKPNRTDHTITIPRWGGSKVIFRGLDDPMALRSVNGIGGHLEEASLLSEAAYLEFLGRLRQAKQGQPIRVVLTTNPQTTRGWLHEHFVKNAGVTTETVRGNDVRVCRRRVIAKTLDNPFVSDAYIAAMASAYDPELYRIMVLGEDGDYTAGLVCNTWNDANIEETPYRPDLRLYLSCDFNVDPMSWVVAHRYNGEYHFIDELCLENTTTVQAAEEFFRRYGQHESGLIITGDASGDNRSTQAKTALDTNYTIIRNTLSALGMRSVSIDLRSANPPVEDRTAAWNGMVCNSQGVRRVKVSSKCKWLIHNCQNLRYITGSKVIWEPTIKQIEADPKLKFTKHVWDAASYLVERYDPIKLAVAEHKKPRVSTVSFSPTR